MIELQDIHFSFGNTEVIRGIDLRLNKGENQVLLGLSGSGKTTCLRLMNGLLRPDRGKVLFKGQDLQNQNLQEVRRQMGYVIQKAGLFPHYKVFDNIALVPRLLKWPESRIRSRVHQLMEKLHLPPTEFENQFPAELSGGQQQRVGLARALAADPEVLLMDEPFGALDPITRTRIRHEFLEMDELRNKTLVLVTHDVQEAFELGDQIAIVHQGKILQNAPPAEILKHPADAFVNEFIAADRLNLELQKTGLYSRWNQRLLKGANLDDLLKSAGHE